MTKKERKQNPPSKTEAYNAFISQIDIVDIRLVSAKAENIGLSSSMTSKNIRMKAAYQNNKGTIEVLHHYYLTTKDTKTKETVAKFSVEFNVIYSSDIEMTDDIFDVFNAYNIPLNTWPYFREFTQSMFTRMGYLGAVAPTFKTSSKPRDVR